MPTAARAGQELRVSYTVQRPKYLSSHKLSLSRACASGSYWKQSRESDSGTQLRGTEVPTSVSATEPTTCPSSPYLSVWRRDCPSAGLLPNASNGQGSNGPSREAGAKDQKGLKPGNPVTCTITALSQGLRSEGVTRTKASAAILASVSAADQHPQPISPCSTLCALTGASPSRPPWMM